MGSVHDDPQGLHSPENGFVDLLSGRPDGEGFRSFNINGLASDQTTTPTGMREELLLLSWIIVLLRTRDEDSQISYDWAYKSRENNFELELVKGRLSLDEVTTGLQNNVGLVISEISRHISKVASSQDSAVTSPVSLLLSTSSLSQMSEEAKDEGILHLELRYVNNLLEIRPLWYTEAILEFTITHFIETLVDTIKTCISNPECFIEDCVCPTTHDMNEIWRWNHQLPPTYSFCMHDMISERAKISPEKVAIDSWDGTLTYAQIDQYSTLVACSLKEMGVKLHDVLPVCFEKSRWTIVAVLAVMKVGATLLMTDPTLPLARLQNMAEQVSAKVIVTSRNQYEFSESIVPSGKIMVVDADTFTHFSNLTVRPRLEAVPPSTLMYIIFTSGSTGTPKGVMLSHETYTSSAVPRAKAVGYTEDSRVLDFAAYAFDVSIDSMLLTLGNGGCLCIPSDEDRLNDINGVMRKMQVNYAGLTPSVARILDPDVIKSLSGLGLGGEASSVRDVMTWGQDTRIIIGYGPCECTIGCTINSDTATGRNYISIGEGNGAAIWITHPDDHELLMPVGAVGELLVEGPIVGQGYLNDPEKTAAAFIKDPSWLTAGHNGYAGRQGRLYKTGDLGKYDPDGSGGILFVGRKDTQVKLRGQRVELGEIESQLMAWLPSEVSVIAEVIVPQGLGGQPTLVAFIGPQQNKGQENTDINSIQLPEELGQKLSNANTELSKVLPRYMVPTAYIPVNYIPVLISSKIDRKRLRLFGAIVDLRDVNEEKKSVSTRELSNLEKRLRQAWSQILKLDAESIRLDDNFFALGGDSLAAMKLVTVCREEGLDLSVINTFGHPTLSAMTEVVHTYISQAQTETPAFSMISQPAEGACMEASEMCGSDLAAIEDIYPCTPTQESLFTFALKSTEMYVAQRVTCIPSHIDLNVWKQSWEKVVAAIPILRTRVVQLQQPGLQQVILKEGISWRSSTDLARYLENDRNERMNLGQSLARYAIVNQPADDKRYMVWTIHHVVYDGWSEPLLLKTVSSVLQGHDVDITLALMSSFVKYVRDTDEVAMQEFWRRELEDAVGPQFPRLPSRDYLPTPDANLEISVNLDKSTKSPFTMATLIRGAWALVASQYTGSDDVVFGETLAGRDISLAGVESIVGPLIATVPVRINVKRSSSIESYLQSVQQGMLARIPYQHFGMQNIRKVSQDAQHACETGTGLVINSEPEYAGSDLGFKSGDFELESLHFNPYPLMLACGIRKAGLRICANFDSSLIDITQMERMLAQLQMACSQLTKDLSRRVNEVSCLPEVELNQIWKWNQTPPLSLDRSSKRIRADASIKQGSVYPQAVVSWVCDPQNSSLLSPIGCVGELWLEGAFFSEETVESPAWLVAGTSTYGGRTGRVQPTGDMVRLLEDRSFVFVGRKENVMPVQGHAVDITDFEAHFAKYLPQTACAAAAVYQPFSDSSQQAAKQELIFFIEQPPEEDNVELMLAKYDITCDTSDQQSFKTTICSNISLGLALVLKKLDKFIQDSLPSYMMPFAYVVIDKMPTMMKDVDHGLLNQLASTIPQAVLAELRQGFKEVWSKNSAKQNFTNAENILQAAWAKILSIPSEKIDIDDNFFRLGGDSVMAMKLVSSLRYLGHGLTVADIFQHMRLGDAAKMLKIDHVSTTKVQTYKPFSTLNNLVIETFLCEVVRPKLADPNWSIRDVSPATDSQVLDIRGTVQSLRSSIQYTMLYFDESIDREQLFRACKELVKTHEILRTVFIEHESNFFQVVIEELDTPDVITLQADKDIEKYATDLCTTDIESEFQLGSSFLRILHAKDNNGKECLVIGLSHALYDGVSLPMLLRDLEVLYKGEKVVGFEPFSSYMARICDKRTQTAAVNYWSNLLNDSSLSVLKRKSAERTDKAIFQAKPVDISQRPEEITTANLLTAAWALVLARHLQNSDVTFGSITSGRNIDLAGTENVVGPCYQFTPTRVLFKSQWTAMDLLRFVQRQTAESAAHDFLGFDKISKQCTKWSESSDAQFFDSIVHHQDWDDFDTMPFAGRECKVDILNPHGDAATPFKAVSFVKEGQMHVGVVGSEKETVLVNTALDELVAAIQELATCQLELLLDGQMF
ncbi:Nonribosomal peptide synthetase 4 [Ciborinia camelliae]|nr:Nonribosomal peptide synthetase 4 [Ciborinia camelliae]